MTAKRLDRQRWIRAALALSVATMLFNLLEGLVSIRFGWEDHSVALAGFGVDSLVEVASAALIYWRFRRDRGQEADAGSRKERLATRGIGGMLLALALGTAAGAVPPLLHHAPPGTTLPGLVISAVSLAVMFMLWRAKLRTASALDSPAMRSDAACSLACMRLSSVILLGSLLFWVSPRLWWCDAAAALLIASLIAKEGLEGVRASLHPEFSGGCGCGHD